MGLHSGSVCSVRLEPAGAGSGILLNGSPLSIDNVQSSTLATTVSTPEGPVGTIEHLLAALFGAGIDDINLWVHGGEVPILDGTAGAWRAFLKPVESTPSTAALVLDLEQVVEIVEGDSSIRAEPWPRLTICVDVDFATLGRFTFECDATRWEEAGAARTFGFMSHAETLRDRGLARGANLDNTLVFEDDGDVLNQGGLRSEDEIARHKWIDCLGDLALLGRRLNARVTAVRAGHRLHHALVRRLKARII